MLNEVDSIRAQYHCDAIASVDYGDGDYYVYIHFRNDTGFPFYVGKGKKKGNKDRAYEIGSRRNDWWNRIVNKHGHTVKVIENCGSDEEMSHSIETETIATLRELGFELVNMTDGGEGSSGWIPSAEWCNKQSLLKTGENHPMWGKTLSEETRRKISEANTGQFIGEKNPNWGKTLSEETRRKISEANTGKFVGEDSPHWGKEREDYVKEKISLARMGKYMGKNNGAFTGYAVGVNNENIIIFCGYADIKSRGFNPGNISAMILKRPIPKSCKGYTEWFRTLDKSDIINLLETRTFADIESQEHFNNW